MDIVRNADGTLVVPVQPPRQHDTEETETASAGEEPEASPPDAGPTTG